MRELLATTLLTTVSNESASHHAVTALDLARGGQLLQVPISSSIGVLTSNRILAASIASIQTTLRTA